MKKFVHLHTHSHYSLLTALPKIKELVKAAKKDDMEALALTDNANLYGAIEFYQQCQKEGVKPIIGIDAYLAKRSRLDKEARIDNKRNRIVLLAKNVEGYKNLIKLVTIANMEGFYYKPRIDKEVLEKNAAGLIGIASSWNGDLSDLIAGKDFEKAEELADWYKKIFGEDSFYLEISSHPEIEGYADRIRAIADFGKKHTIPLVAGQEVFYLHKDDKPARDTLLSIQTSHDFSEKWGMNDEEDFSFITQKEAEKKFKEYPEALANTVKIAEMCNLELELGKWVFPNYELKSGKTYDEELREVVYRGLEERKVEKTPEIIERVEYELKVIADKGYTPYFLVVSDLLKFAHDNEILTTVRGSVAGSMVTYLSKITNVNPIEYNLPFERFLNPWRPSAPDIDMDISDVHRDTVIDYARRKYGKEKVAQIGTFGTMMARGAVRDVARALGYPYSTGDMIAKLIPMGSQGFPMTIERALKEVPELKELYKKDEEVQEIIHMAQKIEGCARHISVHAAGVVISPSELTDFVPLQYDTKGEGKIITQYDMHAVEDAGLLKFDFLGLKNLTILSNALKILRKLEGTEIDIENIPLDDKKTFELLARGETVGLFQLNGAGMTKELMDLKPTQMEDINVMIALYRPGPMATIHDYVARKQGRQPITYYHPKMEKFLDKSLGLLVYQDDLLFTAMELAGYNWESVDKFRKAVGKKIPEEMAKQHEIFVKGCQEHSGMTKDEAEKIWKLFEPFQGYGFNKAHAASYGKVAYQTAYMKANFPAIYMAAVLTADSGDIEKIGEFIAECKRMGIEVLPPDINESFSDFTVVRNEGEEDKIRFGLTSIKNFGEGIANTIIEERKNNGKFTDIEDFLSRITDRNLNKKSLEALIKCGAMDTFDERGKLFQNIERMLTYSKEFKGSNNNHDSLFSSIGGKSVHITLDETPPATLDQKLSWEKELLGLYISGHPLDKFKEKFEKNKISIKKIKDMPVEGNVVVGGIIEDIKKFITKGGETMAFMKIADLDDNIEVVVFPRVFEAHKEFLESQKCVKMEAKFSKRNGSPSLIAEKIALLV